MQGSGKPMPGEDSPAGRRAWREVPEEGGARRMVPEESLRAEVTAVRMAVRREWANGAEREGGR